MVEVEPRELVAIRHNLVEYFEDFLDCPYEEFINTLLRDVVEIINALSMLRESTKLYKRHIKKAIFERIIKNEEIVRSWNQRPIQWLREEIFSFLCHHHFIIENVPDKVDQIRIIYELGSKAISLKFSLMSDEEKIKILIFLRFEI